MITRRRALTALIFAAIMLNYVDRQMLALLKPTLQAEFHWTDRDYAHLASAFQFAAAFAFLGVGAFLDRVGLRRGFATSVAGWSIAAMAHAVAFTVTGFVGVRIALGMFEAAGTPAAVKSAATYYGPRDRSKLLGLGNMAPNIGAIAAPLAIPPLALWLGWRQAFLVAGGLGLAWVIAWLALRPPPEQPHAATARPSIATLLGERRQWALIAAKALTDQIWFFMLSFLPDFFHRAFGLPQGKLGLPVALVYAMAALGALSGGYLPARLLAAGLSANAARKRSLLVYACLIVPVPLVLWMHDPWKAAALLGLALFAHQGFSTNVFGLATDLFPARIIGTAIGLAAFAGNMSGAAMLEFAGWSLARGHGYAPMFAIAAASYLLGLAAIEALVPRIEAHTE